jgi:hypothetical protein
MQCPPSPEFSGPTQGMVYPGPNQSLQDLETSAANGLVDRIGRNPLTARVNIVT